MQKEQDALIALVRQQVTGQAQALPETFDWHEVCHQAQRHGVGAMVYCAAKEMGLSLPDKLEKALYIDYQRAIFRDVQFRSLAQRVSQGLEQRGIPHILLRGICLKENYPVSALRTMSDLDILVHEADYDAIRNLAESMGAVAGHMDGNHRNFRFPEGLTVEFHPELIHCDSPVGTGVNPGWQYAAEERPGAMTLTEEGFYLNTLAHLANHFAAGGVGIRFVLDIWICRHRRAPQPDRGVVERELKRIGLYDFAVKIEALAEAWFSGSPETEEMRELAEYIITSGAHGERDRAMLNAVSLSKHGSGASALAGKMFFSRQEMEQRYLWVKGRPWLLPAAWLARAFRAVKRHGDLILKWGKGTLTVSRSEAKEQREKLKRFGITTTKSGDEE